MSEKHTIHDIARIAGVGASTVTRVLNDHPYVSDKTRAKVLKVIEELDYRPSYAARHMRTQKSRLIGFISDEVATAPYAGDIIRGAQEAAWQEEKILLAVSAGRGFQLAQEALEVMVEREVEGVIYAAMYHRQVNLPASIGNIPIVLANCFDTDRKLPSVVPDEVSGGYQATLKLIEQGHRRVGLINVNTLESKLPAAVGRLEGYKTALDNYNIRLDNDLIRYGTGMASDGYQFTHELMNLAETPTAIFCGNDRTALGAYEALRELGKSIPDDVAIIGFDNMEVIADALRPALSTMQLPHYEMGKWAIQFLSEHNEDELPNVQQELDCPFVERAST